MRLSQINDAVRDYLVKRHPALDGCVFDTVFASASDRATCFVTTVASPAMFAVSGAPTRIDPYDILKDYQAVENATFEINGCVYTIGDGDDEMGAQSLGYGECAVWVRILNLVQED